ncbi:MAG: Lrp/AsnC family transcriptional regulator [Holosporales bacterium]|jgi:DNA-binding Lrp family transcriptional regulator|nr:Lrp/AsnC family transcriptional regulator [Holosporales bacterium]
MVELDRIDNMILEKLQRNGRMTNVELAETVGISPPPCLRRLKFLEQKGIISGYHAELNRAVLGYKIKALCIVSISSQFTGKVESFVKSLEKSENIRECESTAGNEFFILTIIARNLEEYEEILRDYIQSSKVVSNVKSYILTNNHKCEYGLPIKD